MADTTWGQQLAAQWSWHWDHQLRARLRGLADEEYLWEPVADCWTIHPGPDGATWAIDWAFPAPDPPPVTTVAWRLAHLVVGVFGDRNARHFGAEPISYDTYAFPTHAADSLADLDRQVDTWLTGVRELSDERLTGPCGEPGYEDDWMAALVLHVQREAIHHGAEIALLRDLYAHGLR